MSTFLQEKYLLLVSNKLDRFKKKGRGYNFRCPFCGDSEKNKLKARGYVYEKKGDLWFYCQNEGPGSGRNFGIFLKELNPTLYKQYAMEKFKYNNNHKWHHNKQDQKEQQVKNTLKVLQNDPLNQLDRISDLSEDHPARIYCKDTRKIDPSFFTILYYTDNYCKWINDFVEKDKFSTIHAKDPRIVVPFYGMNGLPFAYQGRAIGTTSQRFITISPNRDSEALIYGLERIDPKKPIHVVEAPIDSLMIDNCLAAAGSGLKRLLELKYDFIFIFDNECRNEQILKLMKDIIKAGKKIVIWPTAPDHKEDPNDMIKAGMTKAELQKIINDNVTHGLGALLKLAKWSKV